ncbi:hypothetical protein QFC19_002990 [Naganishia cerealis]|uniref:Uncharacterized protein n=1 Tax=Naganishia cerealis TaxID=610337 RepID=A0ACC2W726_9TREE|nr:hypothetical protein QFC19_002990 [Naganishia cerealis]
MSQPRINPLNRRARRRLALTSALNNPPSSHVAPSSPAALTAVPSLPSKKRKRRRIEDVSHRSSSEISPSAPRDSALAPASGQMPNASAGPSRHPMDHTAIGTQGETDAIQNHLATTSTPSIQQQFQDRAKLMAVRESKARLEVELRTLGEEVQAKNELLSSHGDTIDRLKQNFTCNICFELFRDPHALAPCGHTACASCLLGWFSSVNSLLHQPERYDPANSPNYTRNRTKCCFTCRTPVVHKPIPSYILKDTVHALSTQLRFQSTEAESLTENVSAADREAMWNTVFKEVTNRAWYIDEEDLGVRRCGRCGHEITGRNCSHCNEHFSDLSAEDSDGSDSEDYSDDDSIVHYAGRPGFVPGRWPGEDTDEEDEFLDGDGWHDIEVGQGDEWARAHRRNRHRNNLPAMNFEFGFQGAVLDNVSVDEDERESYEGSFIDDENAGLERHFMRGYDFDGDDDEDIDDDADGDDDDSLASRDRTSRRHDPEDTWEGLDRHGRPTRIAGRRVAYSPSYDGSRYDSEDTMEGLGRYDRSTRYIDLDRVDRESSNDTWQSAKTEADSDDGEARMTGSRTVVHANTDDIAEGAPRQSRRVQRVASVTDSESEEIGQPRRRRRVAMISSDDE